MSNTWRVSFPSSGVNARAAFIDELEAAYVCTCGSAYVYACMHAGQSVCDFEYTCICGQIDHGSALLHDFLNKFHPSAPRITHMYKPQTKTRSRLHIPLHLNRSGTCPIRLFSRSRPASKNTTRDLYASHHISGGRVLR